jgi:dsDNA-specific endonuclease/ATPase MutS2
MPVNEEIEEHAHHAHEPFDKTVAGTMAIIAALLAVVSVLGQHFQAEELLDQQQASDQWAFYQAKDIRRYAAQVAEDTLMQLKGSAAPISKYVEDEKRYLKQRAEIQERAREFERERDKSARKAVRFHVGEVFLEVAIVFSSLSILLKQRALFMAGAGAALLGVVISLTALSA